MLANDSGTKGRLVNEILKSVIALTSRENILQTMSAHPVVRYTSLSYKKIGNLSFVALKVS